MPELPLGHGWHCVVEVQPAVDGWPDNGAARPVQFSNFDTCPKDGLDA